MLDEMRRWQKIIDAAPPPIHRIMASHAVPYGRAFKQWDTNGRLLVWANRGEIVDLPRASKPPAGLSWSMISFGVDVVFV